MVPTTLAIIMDGNSRWAEKEQKRSSLLGHTKGYRTAQTIIRAAFDRGVSHLAVWAASRSNFEKRSRAEMQHLGRILKYELRHRRRTNEEGRLRIRGDWSLWHNDTALAALVYEAESVTAKYSARNLWVLFGYDAKTDDLQARMSMYRDKVAPTDEELESRLWTAGLPTIDLLIRTGCRKSVQESGEEMSITNDSDGFLWRHRQDTVIVSTNVLWPDFSIKHLDCAFDLYHSQPRRAGGRASVNTALAAE